MCVCTHCPSKVQVQWFPARGQRPQVAKVFSHVSMEVHHQVRVSLEELQQLFGKHSLDALLECWDGKQQCASLQDSPYHLRDDPRISPI